MTWSSLFLGFIAVYAAYQCYGFYKGTEKIKYLSLFIALLLLISMQCIEIFDIYLLDSGQSNFAGILIEWGHVLSLSFVLSAMASFIRDSKPAFARYPRAYAALPFLIVISYFLVKDTFAIKDWLISIYQGGAILVAILMYAVYTYREHKYSYILGGTIVILVTFISYWYISFLNESFPWLWKLMFGIGLLTVIYGYKRLNIIKNLQGSSN